MEPRLLWTQLDSPLQFSNGRTSLLAFEIGFTEIRVRLHEVWTHFGSMLKRLYRAFEVARIPCVPSQ
jgi:hypothetical protein